LHPLTAEGQGWVSACLLSHVSEGEVSVTISLRGPHAQLATTADERAGWPIEEGAFYGNVFKPLDQPIEWFACRGEGQAAGEFGGLVDRDCAEPDPANPGRTLCGFTFAGDCGTFSAKPVCEQFSEHGQFYRRCHTTALDHHGDPHDRRGACDRDDRVFHQVITAYVTP
jgi:hypothetical protein